MERSYAMRIHLILEFKTIFSHNYTCLAWYWELNLIPLLVGLMFLRKANLNFKFIYLVLIISFLLEIFSHLIAKCVPVHLLHGIIIRFSKLPQIIAQNLLGFWYGYGIVVHRQRNLLCYMVPCKANYTIYNNDSKYFC